MAIATTTAAILGATVLGSAAILATSARKASKQSTPSLPAPPPAPTIKDASQTAKEQTVQERNRRTPTRLTSPTGLLSQPNLARKSLLGE